MLDGIPDVREPCIERCEPEPQKVRRAKVTDHTTVDQGLHHRIATFMRERYLATALRRSARACECQAEPGAAFLYQRDEALGQ